MSKPTDAEIAVVLQARLLQALSCGPHCATLIDVLEGRRRVVAIQHPTRPGWIIQTEAVE